MREGVLRDIPDFTWRIASDTTMRYTSIISRQAIGRFLNDTVRGKEWMCLGPTYFGTENILKAD